MLFGDPALRLPRFDHRLKVHVDGRVETGATIEITGAVPEELKNASGTVSISRPLTTGSADLRPMPSEKDPAGRRAAFLHNHAAANSFVLVESPVTIRDRRYSATLTLPGKLPSGTLVVRVLISNETADGLGVSLLPSNALTD